MTVDLSDFDAVQDAVGMQGRPCGFCVLVAKLSPTQQAQLRAALNDEKYTAVTIGKVLVQWGVDVDLERIRRHRGAGLRGRQRMCNSMTGASA